jgi:hypothetical protein
MTSMPLAQFLQQQQVPAFVEHHAARLGHAGTSASPVAARPSPRALPVASLPEMLSQQFKRGHRHRRQGKTIAIIGSDGASAKRRNQRRRPSDPGYKVTYAKGAFHHAHHRLHAVRAGDHDLGRRKTRLTSLYLVVVQRRPGPAKGLRQAGSRASS